MIGLKNIIRLPVSDEAIRLALTRALQHQFRDNLRNRPPAVQLDCKIRGYLGEIVLKEWFSQFGISFSQSNYIEDDADIDIDLRLETPRKAYNFEIKTSLIPDGFKTLRNSLQQCDIKLIRRTEQFTDLRGDIHIQLFYRFLRQKRDNWLAAQQVDWSDPEAVYNGLQLSLYQDHTFLVGWIDKPTLEQYLAALPADQRVWSFAQAQKTFWKCNLQTVAHPPEYLRYYVMGLLS
ncbi:MAG TPA: hypothetical protein DCM08_13855 [Microscillaceae bacterium]|nr:hypothetical protein [Microscillaceae bacterium]